MSFEVVVEGAFRRTGRGMRVCEVADRFFALFCVCKGVLGAARSKGESSLIGLWLRVILIF